jgi:hypothetical protein
LIKPGQQVPTVKDLAQAVSVSTKVAFTAIQDLRAEGWLEQAPNRRHLVSADAINKLLAAKEIAIGFTSRGVDHIYSWPYQAIFNHLSHLVRSMDANLMCRLELDPMAVSSPPKHYDALIATDWIPQDARRFCSGPIVALESWEGIEADYTVKTDHYQGGYLIAQHLRQRGHQKVVYWDLAEDSPGQGLRGIAYRKVGFLKGWLDAGGDLNKLKTVRVSPQPERLKSVVQENVREAEAFFVFADKWALRIWAVLDELGVKVPGDLALAGYDGLYDAIVRDPPLTTIKQDFREMARHTFDLIVCHLTGKKNEKVCQDILVTPELFPGGTA